MSREKRDFRLRRKTKELAPEKLMEILYSTTTEKDAEETYERLTGEKPPGKKTMGWKLTI